MILLFSLLLLLALSVFMYGCAKPQCRLDSDCPSSRCKDYTCISNKCIATPRSNCCGNGICERDAPTFEDKCTCAADCGACPSATNSTFLVPGCSKDQECFTQVNGSKVTEQTFTNSFDIEGGKLLVTYVMDAPYDISTSVMKVKYQVGTFPQNVHKVKIDRIAIYELTPQGEEKLLGDQQVNKFLYDLSSEIDDEVVLQFPMQNAEEKKKIDVGLDLEKFDMSSGVELPLSKSLKMPMTSSQITFVSPTKIPSCPASCNDNNQCTFDHCGPETNYFCRHDMSSGACCGNTVCDANEDPCGCPQDCGQCARLYGSYIEYKCISGRCKSALKSTETLQTQTKTDEKDLIPNSVKISFTPSYDLPFDMTKSEFSTRIELLSKSSDVTSIVCSKIQVLDSNNNLLVEKDMDEKLDDIGSGFTDQTIPVFSLGNVEKRIDKVSIKLTCDITRTVNNAPQTAKYSTSFLLGTLTFINPDV